MEPVIYYTQGCDVLTSVGGLHQFMKWDRPLLTVCFQFFSFREILWKFSFVIHNYINC